MLCHWPDNNVGVQENIYKQSPVYPAMLAFAERIWRGSSHERFDMFAQTPQGWDDPDWPEWTMFERDLTKHRDTLLTDVPFQFVRNSQARWELLGPFELSQEPEHPRAEKDWTGPVYGGTVQVHHKFDFPSFTAKRSGVVFARAFIQSDRDREITAWIGFDDFSRSGGRRGGPFAALGQWSRHGSQVWVNGKEIAPPDWNQPGLPAVDRETPFVDELYWIRKPTTIKLKEGLNEILIRAPHKDVGFGWMFTFMPVDLSRGTAREVEGVSFGSPYGGISPS
jgi:hypothetical protein